MQFYTGRLAVRGSSRYIWGEECALQFSASLASLVMEKRDSIAYLIVSSSLVFTAIILVLTLPQINFEWVRILTG